MTDARAQRLRVACALLAPEPAKEGGLRTPLEQSQALATIRGMSEADRATLSGHIDWVLEFEAHDFPEKGSTASRQSGVAKP